MGKAIVGILALIVLIPAIQPGSPPRTATTRPATTKPTELELLIREDDSPRFAASLDSVSTNGNGGLTATVTLQNCSTQPYYIDDGRLPRNVSEQIRIWPVESDKCIIFGSNNCVLYADPGLQPLKKLAPEEKYTVTVEFGGTGDLRDFYDFKPQEIPFQSPPFKYLPIGRMAVTLQLGLCVYSSNPASYVDRMRYEKWVICQCSDLKWLTVTKTWP